MEYRVTFLYKPPDTEESKVGVLIFDAEDREDLHRKYFFAREAAFYDPYPANIKFSTGIISIEELE